MMEVVESMGESLNYAVPEVSFGHLRESLAGKDGRLTQTPFV